jgi:hypothetical protein
MADSSVGEMLSHSVIVSLLSERNVMDVERVIERDSTLLETMHNISVSMESDMEVSGYALEFDKASQSAALVLLKFLLYSILQGLTVSLLLLPGLSREDSTVLAKSIFMHVTIVVRDVLTKTVFNIKRKDITGNVGVLYVDVYLDSIALMASLEGKTRVGLRVHVITHLTGAEYNQNTSTDERN